MSKNNRFSKKALAAEIKLRLKNYKFDRYNGYAQVIGKGEQANREYGAFRTLLDIAYAFELDLSEDGE